MKCREFIFNICRDRAGPVIVLLVYFLLLTNPIPVAAGCGHIAGRADHILLSWTGDPLTTQTISWQAGAGSGQDSLQYIAAAKYDGTFSDVGKVKGKGSPLDKDYWRFTVTLRGLLPKTEYLYRVGGEGDWSEPASFTTAAPEDRFSFLYMGDVQEGYEDWGDMLAQVWKENPQLRFVLMGGDLVDKGNDLSEWQQFLIAAGPVFRSLPLLAAVGNHDDTNLFRTLFALPTNGPKGHEGTVYSFDYGNCHITILNSNCMGIPGTLGFDDLAHWLRQDLASSRQTWKFVVFHHPPYQVVQNWRGEHLQKNWVPFLEEGGVDLVFSGHQHVYMRTKPLWEGCIQPEGQGIVYVMGNSGTKYYGPGPDQDYITQQVAWVSNYQLIEIDGNTLYMTAKAASGEVIDTYRIVKGSGVVDNRNDEICPAGFRYYFIPWWLLHPVKTPIDYAAVLTQANAIISANLEGFPSYFTN